MNRGMSLRLVVMSAVCSFVGALVGVVLTGTLLIQMCLTRVKEVIPKLDVPLRQQCEHNPRDFHQLLSNESLILYFYNADTFEPASPEFPPVDSDLRERWTLGENAPARVIFFSRRGGVFMRRVADRGPCSLVQVEWSNTILGRWKVGLSMLAILLASTFLTAILVHRIVVRPVLLRIHRLRQATQRVGKSAGYVSAADPEIDDLGQLSILLDEAHARIAADAARSAARQTALEQHLANVAHDLRTPLSSLQLTIEELAADTRGHRDLIRSAIDEIVYMGSLIENLYLACRLEEGADPLANDPRVDLCAVVDDVSRRFSMLGRARGIEVIGAHPDGAVWATCNSTMAARVLANLVHNAVSYGQTGGHVGVVLESTKDAFSLMVIDDGPGVPPEDLPRIGERTFRSDEARQRDDAGGGLGLAIVGEVCRRAGFIVTYGTEEPRGLRVTISGPRRI